MKRRSLFASSCALFLAGCASAAINSWQISAISGPVKGGTGIRLGVRSIGLPGALSQPGVPAPGPANAANTFPNDLWAAPLGRMLQTSMVENLSQRLPRDTVLADGGAIGAMPDQYIEIQILNFAPDASGLVTLKAQLAIRPVNSLNWTLENFSTSAAGGDTASSITACMSMLWGQMADKLAAMLA